MSHLPAAASSRRATVIAGLTGLLLGSSCASAPPTATTPAPASRPVVAVQGSPSPISRAQVDSATIAGLFDAPITLTSGRYEGPPVVPGAASRPTAVLLTPLVTLGELDDAPGTDAAALIASNEGGSGERITLAIVGVRDGHPVSVATALVGDRTRIRRLHVEDRAIVLDVVEAGAGEPACCGTQLATKTYRSEAGRLTLTSSVVTGALSLATLAGPTWTAVAIDGTALPTDSRPPTLTLVVSRVPDGPSEARLSGFTGCNQYSGSIKEPEPGRIAVGPAAATRRACPGEGQAIETRYLKALEQATRYTFVAGRLHLSGPDGATSRSVAFDAR